MRNYAILGVFAGAFYTQNVVAKRTEREGFAWIVAFAVLIVVGSITDGWIS